MPDAFRNILDGVIAEMRRHRQQQHFACALLGDRKGSFLETEVSERLLLVQAEGVMDRCLDPALRQQGTKPIAVFGANRVVAKDTFGSLPLLGESEGQIMQSRRILGGDSASGRVPSVEMVQLDAENRRLQSIEARIAARDSMVVLRGLAVVGDQSHPCGEVVTIGDDRSAITHRAEVLAWVEAKHAASPILPTRWRSPLIVHHAPCACAASSMMSAP